MTHEPFVDPERLRAECSTGWRTGTIARQAIAGEKATLDVYRCLRCQQWHSTLKEKPWHSQVVKIIRTFGWTHAHFRPLMTRHGWATPVSGDGKGFPDFILAKPPRLLVAELKTDDEKSSCLAHEQQAWLDLFAACGVEAYVWRPRDQVDVARILSGRPVVETTRRRLYGPETLSG